MILFALFICVLTGTWGEPQVVEPPLRVDMTPPEGSDDATARNVLESFIRMPIDHFDPLIPDTYNMRYMYNEEFFGGIDYPIFILVGGEWDIVAGWLRAGNMYEMARENRGYMVYTEHRYYGRSLPYQNFTAETLRFLNVDQALADLAYFIRDGIRTQPRFANSKIILYGGSYAANMVLWFKQRYPHLVEGAVASSGPILAQVDFTGYLEVVHEAFLLEGGGQCISTIRQGIQDTITAMRTDDGRRLLERNYRLCEPLNYDNEYDMGYFGGLISWTFSSAVQTARPGTVLNICNNFRNNVYGVTPMDQIGGFIAAMQGLQTCWVITYNNLLNTYRQRTNSRAWYYQTCTEYGYYQTAPRSGTVFDPLTWLSVDFYVDICKQVFDPKSDTEYKRTKETKNKKQFANDFLSDNDEESTTSSKKFDEAFVHDAVNRVNTAFGGLQPDVNRTINIHGHIDPWRALGVYNEDLKEGSPTYTVPRASHCFDMQGWLTTDTIRMTQTQQRARRLVASWLS